MAKAENEVAVNRFSDMDMAGIKTLADAQKYLEALGVEFVSSADYGAGFVMLENKDLLVGRDFLILEMDFYPGDYGNDFAVLKVVTALDEKFIVTDGGKGICEQAKLIKAERTAAGAKYPGAGIVVKGGFTTSDFFYNSETKETSTKNPGGKEWAPARTYYLSEG